MATLPTELQEIICSFVEEQQDLACLAQTSRRFALLVEKHLYRSVRLKSTIQAGLFARAIKHGSRSRHVRELVLDIYNTNFGVYDWAAKQLPDTNKDRDAYLRGRNFSTRILSHFQNIETLHIHATIWPFHAVRAELDKIVSHGSLAALRSCKSRA